MGRAGSCPGTGRATLPYPRNPVRSAPMTAPPSSAPPAATEVSPAVELQVRRAQAQMTFDRSRGSNMIGAPVGLLISWVLWPWAAHGMLVAWVVAKCATMLVRLWLIRRNLRDGPARTLHWLRRYEAALFVDGALYGLLATVLQPREPPLLGMAMLATVIAIGAVGLVVLSTNQRATLAFTVPAILPGALWQLALGETVTVYGGLGMLLFLALVVAEGRRASEHTLSMLRVRFRLDELAHEREQALQLAERSNAAKDQFIATISHEVRTPLHGILGLTRLLQRDAAGDGDAAGEVPAAAGSAAGSAAGAPASPSSTNRRRRAERLRTIERSGEHLLAIINDVLDHNRIEGGQLRLYEEPFDLVALVGESVELQRAAAQDKGLYLSWLADMPSPRWVRGDAARVRQVLLNLLSNAVKFSERGGVDLRVAHTADGQMQVEVCDSGPGVPPADRERIFLPFEQLDGSFARRHGGTGLGLAISRQLARAMQGDIECRAAPGGGALFRLRLVLPLCEAPDAPPLRVLADAPPSVLARPGPLLSGHVLLVEDNAVNAIVAETSLEHMGLDVTTVGDGQAAVSACSLRRYDLVLMDCQLPGIDGFEATRRIRAEEKRRSLPPMPIVALTANALAGDRERCLAAGMDDHLAKPFTEVDLHALLRQHLTGAGGG
ncbi:MAG: response regulator [Burkholderiales bacterium]|nr:response regulator [Burkholderiales bacterium]